MTTISEVERIAKQLHEAYEAHAVANGWKTQDSCQVAWEDLTKANRLTMLNAVQEVIFRKTRDPVRKLDGQAERVETGPVQFGDDWPGLFVRGDNCAYYQIAVDNALRALVSQDKLDTISQFAVSDLANLLRSVRIGVRG